MTSSNDVVELIQLAPDAGLVKSLGANHTLESAIADIVDNSLDAGAKRVAIRLLTHDDRLSQVEVVDDGLGMGPAEANAAMTIGHQRAYAATDLGNFGMGLKAASFAHGDVLTLWSRKAGEISLGRRIRRVDFSRDFSCEVLSEEAAELAASQRQEVIGVREGTTVLWTKIRNGYRGASDNEARVWLATAESALRSHLGVVFHRLLESGRLTLDVLVDEIGATAGLGIPVRPINPFGYATSGHPDYPKTLIAKAGDGVKVRMQCHIWPPKSDVTGFRIGAKTGEKYQGFYIYRNDRLLQVGGWSDTANASPAKQLARVLLDDSRAVGSFVTMNPEKSGLKFEPSFHDAVHHANGSDGTTFESFLADAESTFSEANRRKRSRRPSIQPDKGFAPLLRRRIGNELPMIDGVSVDLKWRSMPEGEFFDVDLSDTTLWLNSRYRSLFTDRGSLNDAPVIKALLYLLTHEVFEGQHLGSRDKDEIALWKSVLGAAVIAEEQARQSY